jgi:hypothetical protein
MQLAIKIPGKTELLHYGNRIKRDTLLERQNKAAIGAADWCRTKQYSRLTQDNVALLARLYVANGHRIELAVSKATGYADDYEQINNRAM